MILLEDIRATPTPLTATLSVKFGVHVMLGIAVALIIAAPFLAIIWGKV